MNKSILSLLSVLSRIRSQGANSKARYPVNAHLKVLGTLLLVLLVSLSRSSTFVVIVITYLLLILCTMQAREIVSVLKLGFGVTLFTFVLLLPAVLLVSGYSPIPICEKVFATVTAVGILSRTTRWDHIMSACKRFFVPDLFIFVLDSAIRYILMLGEFSLEMLQALKLRSVGKNKAKNTALSGVAGTMFLKSGEMAEELQFAMECRGFTGEYHVTASSVRLGLPDGIFCVVNAGMLLLFIFLSRG